MNLLPFIPGYTDSIYNNGRQPALVVLVAFLITFICVRGYTRIARVKGWRSTHFGGVHTHHLVFGIFMVLLAGVLQFALLPADDWVILLLAAMFGSGAALILDEFALVFYLKDVYWEKEGRKSIDAVVIASIFCLLFLLHTAPFGSSDDSFHIILTDFQLLNAAFVIIAALKGKLFMASLGVFIPTLALIGAIRLAEPDSLYAHQMYRSRDRKKLKKARRRYKNYARTWHPRKERLWDILGGKIKQAA
jgi:hypothetical protein